MDGPGTVGRESKVAPSPRGTFHAAVDANGHRRGSRGPVNGWGAMRRVTGTVTGSPPSGAGGAVVVVVVVGVVVVLVVDVEVEVDGAGSVVGVVVVLVVDVEVDVEGV